MSNLNTNSNEPLDLAAIFYEQALEFLTSYSDSCDEETLAKGLALLRKVVEEYADSSQAICSQRRIIEIHTSQKDCSVLAKDYERLAELLGDTDEARMLRAKSEVLDRTEQNAIIPEPSAAENTPPQSSEQRSGTRITNHQDGMESSPGKEREFTAGDNRFLEGLEDEFSKTTADVCEPVGICSPITGGSSSSCRPVPCEPVHISSPKTELSGRQYSFLNIGIVCLLVLLVLLAGWMDDASRASRHSDQPSPTVAVENQSAVNEVDEPQSPTVAVDNQPAVDEPDDLQSSQINTKDGAEMVWVPAGEFLMGSDDNSEDEKPQRRVQLDGYWMYKYEVTVAQYRAFCEATHSEMPESPSWGWNDDHPIVNVSCQAARLYAEWAGVSLPTEAQWEKAARGPDGRTYPWGMEWDASKCANSSGEAIRSTRPVGSYSSDASPYGCMDMGGNVSEWCADYYDPNYYKNAPDRNPDGPGTPVTPYALVLRGGSWNGDDSDHFRCAYRISLKLASRRYGHYAGGSPAYHSSSLVGFRCVKTL